MTAPRTLGLLLTALAMVALAACSDAGDTDGAAGPTSVAESQSGVTVSDDTASAPEISIPDSEPPAELVTDVIVPGEGDQVEAGDLLVANYTGVLWDTGEEFDSSWSRGVPAAFGIGTGDVIQGWDQGLVGQSVGSRVLLVIPPELGYGDQENASIPAGSTLVFAVDVVDSFSADDLPEGTEVEDLPDGLPQVSGEPGQQPEISVDGVQAPEQSESVVVVEGSGDPIEVDQTLVAHVVQASLDTGEVQVSTWDGAPLSLPAQSLPGLAEALDGAGAGTRVVTLVSADDNSGEPLVLVIDVIASY